MSQYVMSNTSFKPAWDSASYMGKETHVQASQLILFVSKMVPGKPHNQRRLGMWVQQCSGLQTVRNHSSAAALPGRTERL